MSGTVAFGGRRPEAPAGSGVAAGPPCPVFNGLCFTERACASERVAKKPTLVILGGSCWVM